MFRAAILIFFIFCNYWPCQEAFGDTEQVIRPGYFLTSELGQGLKDDTLVASVIGGSKARLAIGFTDHLETRLTVDWKSAFKANTHSYGAKIAAKYHLFSVSSLAVAAFAEAGPSKPEKGAPITSGTILIPASAVLGPFVFSVGPRMRYAFVTSGEAVFGFEAGMGLKLFSWGLPAVEVKHDFKSGVPTSFNGGIVFFPYPKITVPFYFLTGDSVVGPKIGFQNLVVHIAFST